MKLNFVSRQLPIVGFESPIPRTEERLQGSSRVEFDDGGLRLAEGLDSSDAVKIATSVSKVGTRGFSAPAKASSSAAIISASKQNGTQKKNPGWSNEQLKQLKKSPAKIMIGVVIGVIVLVAGYILNTYL